MIDLYRLSNFSLNRPAIVAKKCMRIRRIFTAAQHRRARDRDNRPVVQKNRIEILSAMNTAGDKRLNLVAIESRHPCRVPFSDGAEGSNRIAAGRLQEMNR